MSRERSPHWTVWHMPVPTFTVSLWSDDTTLYVPPAGRQRGAYIELFLTILTCIYSSNGYKKIISPDLFGIQPIIKFLPVGAAFRDVEGYFPLSSFLIRDATFSQKTL